MPKAKGRQAIVLIERLLELTLTITQQVERVRERVPLREERLKL